MRSDRPSSDDETHVSGVSMRDSLLSLCLNLVKWTFYGLFFAFVVIEIFLMALR